MAQLTPRELELARLFADGLTYDEVAAAVGISPSGAAYFAAQIRRKLGVEKTRQIGPAMRARSAA